MYYIKHLPKYPLLIIAFFAIINSSYAQSYYNSPNDSIIDSTPFDDIGVFNITQIHPTQDTIYFKWYKYNVQMPASWEASICDNGHCNTSLVDSGMMIPIVPGDDGLMSLHINPRNEAGTGIVQYILYSTQTPDIKDTLTWIISAYKTTGIAQPDITEPMISNNREQIICSNLKNEYSEALVLDSSLKTVYKKAINGNEIMIPIDKYAPQIFIIYLKGKRIFSKKILKY